MTDAELNNIMELFKLSTHPDRSFNTPLENSIPDLIAEVRRLREMVGLNNGDIPLAQLYMESSHLHSTILASRDREIERLRSLVERLAPADPYCLRSDSPDEFDGCHHCDQLRYELRHRPACPWLEARNEQAVKP